MEGGVAVGYNSQCNPVGGMAASCGCGGVPQQPISCHRHPQHGLDINQQWSRDLPYGEANYHHPQRHPTFQRHQQSTQILHDILSMKVERHELIANSPPGHCYAHPNEDRYASTPQARFPTPPSSLPSSPEPQQNRLTDFSGYGSSGDSSSRSSPFSSYSIDSTAADSPSASSPCAPFGTGISRVYRYRRSQSSSREGSQSPPPHSSGRSSCTIQERGKPMNFKRQYSPSPALHPQHLQHQTLEVDAGAEGNIPMDLSVPTKKQRMEESCLSQESAMSPSNCCYKSGLDSPPPLASTPPSLKDSYHRHQHEHHNQHHRAHRRTNINPHLAYDPTASMPSSSSSDSLSSESILRSILCGQLSSKSSPPAQEEVVDDLRIGSPFMYTLSSCQGLTRSPTQRVSELIRRAKMRQQSLKSTPSATVVAFERERQILSPLPAQTSPILSLPPSFPGAAVTSSLSPPQQQQQQSRDTVVSLAKKNLLPVTARISDWLVKVVQYVKSLPEFSSLPVNDKVTLVQSSWSRLLLLKMAESNFQFAVNPCPASAPRTAGLSDEASSGSVSDAASSSSLTEPTLESVEGIMAFVRKCQALAITADEMSFLRLLTLFNPSHVAVESTTYIEKINAYVRKCLHDLCAESGSGAGNRRYCQLLLVLLPLFGVRPGVMESLFCKHITVNTDMELLLKEMLHKL